jgi:tetratricopeptide (TPR) repeat protein
MAAGKYREALAWYDRCAEKYPETEIAVRAGLRAALAARESGAAAESAGRYARWITRYPANPGAISAARSLSEVLKVHGSPDLALTVMKQIRDAVPEKPDLATPVILAWTRLAGIPPESLEMLESISRNEKSTPADQAEALLLTAHRYRMDGRYSRSRQLYEVLIRDVPGRIGAEAQEGLARSYAEEGKIDEAAEAYLAVPYLYPDQTDLGQRSLREAENLYRKAGREAEADKVRARINS